MHVLLQYPRDISSWRNRGYLAVALLPDCRMKSAETKLAKNLSRDVFRTLSNIKDSAFVKIVNDV